jgi:hypothetical protein
LNRSQERDPHRRLKDKFAILIEIIVDYILNTVLRFEHSARGQPYGFRIYNYNASVVVG